jgi:hypothetical protein
VPGRVEVLQGFKAGDAVIVAGQARLGRAETAPVRVVDLNRLSPSRGASGTGPRSGAASL